MTNQALAGSEVERFAGPDAAGVALMQQAMERLGMSMRAYHRVLKVARTIADLQGIERILPQHIGEAIGLRRLDRRQVER
jgi:magnesium chelatase family protein